MIEALKAIGIPLLYMVTISGLITKAISNFINIENKTKIILPAIRRGYFPMARASAA